MNTAITASVHSTRTTLDQGHLPGAHGVGAAYPFLLTSAVINKCASYAFRVSHITPFGRMEWASSCRGSRGLDDLDPNCAKLEDVVAQSPPTRSDRLLCHRDRLRRTVRSRLPARLARMAVKNASPTLSCTGFRISLAQTSEEAAPGRQPSARVIEAPLNGRQDGRR